MVKPTWTNNKVQHDTRNVTLDGTNYYIEEIDQMLGTYFFYHTEKMEHLRIAMSWFAVGAKVGGLKEMLFILLGPLAFMYNEKLKITYLLNKFHFHKNH